MPATVALLDGQVHVGLSQQQMERLAHPNNGAVKVSRRDLANCLVQKVCTAAHNIIFYTKFTPIH